VRHMELIVIVVTLAVTVLLLTRVLMNRYADDEDNPVYMCVLCWVGCFRDCKSLLQHQKLAQTGIAPADKSDLNMLSGNVTFVSVVTGDKIAITPPPGPVMIESARQRLYSIDEENPPGQTGVVGVNAPGQVSAVGDDALAHKQHPGGFDSGDFADGDKSSSGSEWGLYDAEDADGTSILDSSVGNLGGGRVGGDFSSDDYEEEEEEEEEDVVTQQFLRNIIISANDGSEDSDNDEDDDDIGEKHGLFDWGVNMLQNQEDSSSDSDDATTANFMRNLTIVSDDSGDDDDVDGGGGSSKAQEDADDAGENDCDDDSF
jgi:hypothetical protein